MSVKPKGVYTVGMTGASGGIYGVSLIQELLRQSYDVHLVMSEAAWLVFDKELQLDTSNRDDVLKGLFGGLQGELTYHQLMNVAASIASGSFRTDGMIVIPCSMGTLSSIAHGASNNLLERAADVMLKEGKPLVIVPRETPLNQLHLENMLKLTQVGAKIIPAMPGFYHLPETIEDLVQFQVGKVLDQLGVEHQLFTRWGES